MKTSHSNVTVAAKEKIKITFFNRIINIFWNNNQVTADAGLNIAINTLGMWTNSTEADWHIIENTRDCFSAKASFNYLPICQIWTMTIKNSQAISWCVDMEIEESLHVDEFRFLCMLNSRYRTWIKDYKQESFPAMDQHWHDLCLGNQLASLVGAGLSPKGTGLPFFTLEIHGKLSLPLIQNPPLDMNSHIMGFRHIPLEKQNDYSPGKYPLLSAQINLFEKGELLDKKTEAYRQNYLQKEKKFRKNIISQKKLKVLLANLPWQKEGKWGVRSGSRWPHIRNEDEGNYLPFPFFLAYAASLLKENNIQAELVDAIAEQIPENSFIDNLSLKEFDILVVETSVPSFYYDLEMLRRLSLSGFPIVLCGPHVEIYKKEFLEKNDFVDFILFNEYEFTLLNLIKALQQGKKDLSHIKGLIWRDHKNNVIKNPPSSPVDINLLPWPYREGLPMGRYWDLPGGIPLPSVQVVASRGCPFSCNFCLWPQVLFGCRTYRTRKVEDVVNEMEYLVREKGFRSIYFDDDTFNIGKERIVRLCKEIIDRGLNTIPWAVMAKADLMDNELLEMMRKAGLYSIKYGVESASQELVDNCGKCLDLAKCEEVVKYTKSLGIKVHLTFTFGLPGETKKTLKKTIEYALKLDPYSLQFSIITPFPGTDLFKELELKGKILTKDWSLYDGHSSCVFQPDNLSPQDLKKAKEYAYKVYAERQRQKRGFRGDIDRFFDYCRNYGLHMTLKKAGGYAYYMLLRKKQYIGKI